MAQTLDQQRADYAWQAAKRAQQELPKFKDFKNLAKGAPALIMGNGLMPSLAFYASRTSSNQKPAEALNKAIYEWLAQRFMTEAAFKPLPKNYADVMDDVMDRLLKAPAAFYMQATDEALAMLKWLRQFAAAIDQESN